MKKISIFIFFLVIISSFVILIIIPKKISILSEKNIVDKKDVPEKFPLPTDPPSVIQLTNTQEYSYYFFTPEKDSFVQLIPNFEEKEFSKQIFEKNQCQFLINGGFYDTDWRPLGLFRINNILIREYSKNRLIDAVLSYSLNGNYHLEFSEPENIYNYVWQIQIGPMLIWNKITLDLKIHADEKNRRSIVAIDSRSQIYFFHIFESGNIYSGPKLSNLPEIMQAINRQKNIDIVSAANLDGGMASAYISNNVKIYEMSLIGSAFCAKQ